MKKLTGIKELLMRDFEARKNMLRIMGKIANPPIIRHDDGRMTLANVSSLYPIGFFNKLKKEKKMPRPTIAGLQERIAELKEENENYRLTNSELRSDEVNKREALTKLLTGEPKIDYLSAYSPSRANTLEWPEIYFKMGELNADANLSCVAETKDRLLKENEDLRDKIRELKRV